MKSFEFAFSSAHAEPASTAKKINVWKYTIVYVEICVTNPDSASHFPKKGLISWVASVQIISPLDPKPLQCIVIVIQEEGLALY